MKRFVQLVLFLGILTALNQIQAIDRTEAPVRSRSGKLTSPEAADREAFEQTQRTNKSRTGQMYVSRNATPKNLMSTPSMPQEHVKAVKAAPVISRSGKLADPKAAAREAIEEGLRNKTGSAKYVPQLAGAMPGQRFVERPIGAQEADLLTNLALETVVRIGVADNADDIAYSGYTPQNVLKFFDAQRPQDQKFIQTLMELKKIYQQHSYTPARMFFDGACRAAAAVWSGMDFAPQDQQPEKTDLVQAAILLAQVTIVRNLQQSLPDLESAIALMEEYAMEQRYADAISQLATLPMHHFLRTFFAGAYRGAMGTLKLKVALAAAERFRLMENRIESVDDYGQNRITDLDDQDTETDSDQDDTDQDDTDTQVGEEPSQEWVARHFKRDTASESDWDLL
jgi:hypothetical protein